MKPAGLYIHIPFCTQKCHYCDFYSCVPHTGFNPYSSNHWFIEKILHDISFFKEHYGIDHWKTVYIGGGTPSLLSASDVCFLASSICKGQHAAIEEFTIEANPEDIQPEWLIACAQGGINRLSIGVQSFNDTVLDANGRRGSGKKTSDALNTIKKHWKGLLSCDLIAGLTKQTLRSMMSDLQRLIDYRVEHISLYGLCSESPLSRAQDDLISEFLTKGFSYLSINDYIQYEVSNFSYKNIYKSIHNQIYWRLEQYVGIGPAACGTLVYEDKYGRVTGAKRFEGIRDIVQWTKTNDRSSVYPYEIISPALFLEEALMMGFRLTEGIDRKGFRERFGADISAYIGKTLNRWKKKGLCRILPKRVFLTTDGMFFLNVFLIDALSELDTSLKDKEIINKLPAFNECITEL